MKYLPFYLLTLLWISTIFWVVNDIGKNYERSKRNKKLIWTNIVVIFPFVGLIAYFVIGKKDINR
jgi:hypothetical protein